MNNHRNIIYELVEKHVIAGLGNKTAIIDESNNHYTYFEIYSLCLSIQSWVYSNNIKPGTQALLLFYDECYSITFLFGLIRAGIIPFYLNPDMLLRQYQDIISITDIEIIFYGSNIQTDLKEFLNKSNRHCFEINEEQISSLSVSKDYLNLNDGDLDRAAFGLFTSGSTGLPKGIIHRHKDVFVMNDNYIKNIVKMNSTDIVFSTSKAFFAYGLNSILSALCYGATVILANNKLDLPKTWNLLSNASVTIFFSVPTIYSFLLKENICPEKISIRLAISAGEQLPEVIQNNWIKRYSLPIIDGIGTTETLSTFISNSLEDFKLGSTGKLVEGFKAKIITEVGEPAEIGNIGVLWIKGDTYPCGYVNNEESTKQQFKDGWFITNDLFYVDLSGYYYYNGRASELIKCGGRWIYPYKIENIICTHPLIDDCIVVGSKQSTGLVRPVAFVVVSDINHDVKNLTKQLQELCKQNLSPWEYPHFIEFCTDLPKTYTGKKQRYKLMEVS